MLTLDFTVRDLHNGTTPTHGRELAALVEDLGWDEYLLWGPDSGRGDRGCVACTSGGLPATYGFISGFRPVSALANHENSP